MMLRTLSAIALTAGLACPGSALAEVKLEHKLPEGKETTTTIKIETKQTLTLGGNPLDTGSTQERVVRSVNGKRGVDGRLPVQSQMVALKSTVSLPMGIELSFDSAKADAPPPGTAVDFLLDVFKAEAKASWTTIYGADNRAIAIEGRDKTLEGLPEQFRAMAAKQYDPDYLVATINRELDKIPSTPLAVGDTWDLTVPFRIEAGQTLTFDTQYKYEGVVQKDGKPLHKITSQTKSVHYSMDADSPSPLKLKESELKVAESSSTLLFDNQTGETVEDSGHIRITGNLTFEAGGNELPSTLDLTLKQSTTNK